MNKLRTYWRGWSWAMWSTAALVNAVTAFLVLRNGHVWPAVVLFAIAAAEMYQADKSAYWYRDERLKWLEELEGPPGQAATK